MQIIIDIPEDDYYDVLQYAELKVNTEFENLMIAAIKNGTPLPKGHGDLIDRKLALSDDGLCEFHMYADYIKMRNYLKSIPTILEADESEERI